MSIKQKVRKDIIESTLYHLTCLDKGVDSRDHHQITDHKLYYGNNRKFEKTHARAIEDAVTRFKAGERLNDPAVPMYGYSVTITVFPCKYNKETHTWINRFNRKFLRSRRPVTEEESRTNLKKLLDAVGRGKIKVLRTPPIHFKEVDG